MDNGIRISTSRRRPSRLPGRELHEPGVQVCDERGLGRIGREIRQLPRIRGQIEQLNVAVWVLDVLVRRGRQAPGEAHVAAVDTALVAHTALRSAAAQKDLLRIVLRPPTEVTGEGGPVVEVARSSDVCPIEDRRDEIDVARQAVEGSGLPLRSANEERHSNGGFVEVTLADQAVLSEGVSVVGGEDQVRVLQATGALELCHDRLE